MKGKNLMDSIYVPILEKTISLEILRDKLDIKKNDVVFISGSVIESDVCEYSKGMGNKYSDLDFFVFRHHEEFDATEYVYSDKMKKVIFHKIDDIGCDVEIYDIAIIDEIINSINSAVYDSSKKVSNMIVFPKGISFDDVNSLLNRTKYSKCIYNEEKYENIKKSIPFEKFVFFRKEYTITLIDNLYDDVIGNVDSQNLDTALYCIRDMVLLLAEVIIMHKGEYVDRRKWAILKVKQLINSTGKFQEFIDLYNTLFLSDLQHDNKLETEINNGINAINQIMDDSY